ARCVRCPGWVPSVTRGGPSTAAICSVGSRPGRLGCQPGVLECLVYVLRRSVACGTAGNLGKGAGYMSISGVGALPVQDTLTRRQLRRALVASTIGTTIEWYDFLLYGNATALYLAPLFFPRQNAFLSTL